MGKIFDTVRKKELVLTPEEKVRQSIIAWLCQKGIEQTLIGREVKISVNGRILRADVVVYDRNCKGKLIIECKSPQVKLSEKILFQVFEYNKVLDCPYIMITNGIDTYCFKRQENTFNAVTDIEGMISDIK